MRRLGKNVNARYFRCETVPVLDKYTIPNLFICGLAVLTSRTAYADLQLDQSQGSITCAGSTPTHAFDVRAKQFQLTISTPDAQGFRSIRLLVPVEQLSMDSSTGDSVMHSQIFTPQKKQAPRVVVFSARTQHSMAAGQFKLEGQLVINGVVRQQLLFVELDVAQEVVIRGGTHIDMRRFAIDAPGFGPFQVADTVDVHFVIQIPRRLLVEAMATPQSMPSSHPEPAAHPAPAAQLEAISQQ
jgi:hypothetical protein